MKTSTIDVKCGIYDTEYTIRDYGTKIVVTYPYIRWVGNARTLDFGKYTARRKGEMALIRRMAEKGEAFLLDSEGNMIATMDGITDGVWSH